MTFRILSLDGGGTWALIEAMALGDLYPGETGHQILSHFDLATANSGGSIVLGGLMLDFTPAQIADFFLDEAKRKSIFFKKPFLEEELALHLPIFPRYVTAQKRNGLGAVFGASGGRQLTDWPATPGWPKGPAGEAVRILIVAFDYDRVREVFLRSYAVGGTGATAEGIALVDAVHASTNAPIAFFDAPAMVSPKRYWDGAMGGYNNPLMAAVVDAIALGADPAAITALTMGTGTVRLLPPDLAHPSTPVELVAPVAGRGMVTDLAKAAGCITDDPPDAATYTAHIVLRNDPGVVGRVVRLSPVVQPVKDPATGAWGYPPGLPAALFGPLTKLGMDAVEAADVALIQKLAQGWIANKAPNQPLRMADDLSCALGHPTYGAAKAHWAKLPASRPRRRATRSSSKRA
ncbi:MAG TPA: patatin-like phospholipase family protein [Caulobacteraceae bacterium]